MMEIGKQAYTQNSDVSPDKPSEINKPDSDIIDTQFSETT